MYFLKRLVLNSDWDKKEWNGKLVMQETDCSYEELINFTLFVDEDCYAVNYEKGRGLIEPELLNAIVPILDHLFESYCTQHEAQTTS